MQGDVNVNNAIYTNMLNNIQQLRVVQAGEVGNVRVVDYARIEIKPVKPRKLVILLGFIAGGFILGACLIFVLRLLSSRGIRSSSDVERETGVSVYAKVPETAQMKKMKKMKTFSLVEVDSEDVACEALRTLRTSLEFSMMDSKVLLVTGLSPGSGKSFISKNLAALIAMNGKKVLLIDTDFRASYMSSRGRKRGLSDYLLGQIALDEAVEHLDGAQVDLLGAGSYS
ncbi:MAG: capsular biosynthesis protein, partial [Fibrobacter sp.]|nr:capsular biosynthesis protein [Fibrobacter sp.]